MALEGGMIGTQANKQIAARVYFFLNNKIFLRCPRDASTLPNGEDLSTIMSPEGCSRVDINESTQKEGRAKGREQERGVNVIMATWRTPSRGRGEVIWQELAHLSLPNEADSHALSLSKNTKAMEFRARLCNSFHFSFVEMSHRE
jgi:hypothetical protein